MNNNECNSTYFKENFIDKKFSINEEEIEDRVIYLAWQKIFKTYMKKYNIKIKDLDNIYVYEEEEKGIIYKALELSFSKINGSMTCNYFTNEFEIYGDYKGYQFNLYDRYDEKAEIYYPVAVFNQDIENLDNKTLKKIIVPEKKNIKWVKDSELSLNNIKKIIEPITYKNEKYYMLYGSIRLDEKSDDEYGNSWIDTYIINLAIDENYNLCGISNEDRKYTIETNKYRGNFEDYKNENYKMTTSLYSASDLSNIYVTTDFNLPPSIIIKEFEDSGYDVEYMVMNSADYGVPQKRERVIIVGFRKDLKIQFEFPDTVIKDAEDYVPLKKVIDAKVDEKYYFSKKAVEGMLRRRETMNKGRAQDIEKPCNTVGAHLAKVSLNSTDPVLMVHGKYRRFTPREVARIQSFPEKFRLSGSEAAQYRALGNAIPPVMFWHVARSVDHYLSKDET